MKSNWRSIHDVNQKRAFGRQRRTHVHHERLRLRHISLGVVCFRCPPHLSFMNGNISSLGLESEAVGIFQRGGETFSSGSLMLSKAARGE